MPFDSSSEFRSAPRRLPRVVQQRSLALTSWRHAVAIVVVSIVLALRTAAYASPPDPSWIAGFWDDGDHDDAVILVTSIPAIADARPPLDAAPARVVVAGMDRSRATTVRVRALGRERPRAPPSP